MGKTIKLSNDIILANDLYSTSERIVGKWIDGKTIYRKCYTGTIALTSAGYFTFSDNNLKNIEQLIKYTYFVKDGTVFVPIPNTGDRIASTYLQTSYGGVGLIVQNSSYYSNFESKPYVVILEYTKK